MIIEYANVNDLLQVVQIANEQFKNEAWTYEQFLDELNQNNRIFLVSKCENVICGYVTALINGYEMEILDIAVKGEYQNKHIASKLLEKLFEIASQKNIEKCFLEVKENNIKAISLYKKFSFKKISERKNYYKDGKNALILEKKC